MAAVVDSLVFSPMYDSAPSSRLVCTDRTTAFWFRDSLCSCSKIVKTYKGTSYVSRRHWFWFVLEVAGFASSSRCTLSSRIKLKIVIV